MDLSNLMNQAKQMQKMIQDKNKEFYGKNFDFSYQGIDITMSGKKEIKKIVISENNLTDKNMLEDFLVVALNRAIDEIEKKYKEHMGPLSQMPTGLI